MNSEVLKTRSGTNTRKIVLIILVTLILAALSAAGYFLHSVFSYDRIYSGVYIENRHAGGLLPSELSVLLKDKYQDQAAKTVIKLQCGKASTLIKLNDLNIKYNIEAAVDKAYSIGREGNLFKRGYEIFQTGRNYRRLQLTAAYDHSGLDKKIDYLFKKIFVSVKEADLIFKDSEEKVIFRTGHHGKSFDRQKARTKVEGAIKALKGGTLKLELLDTPPSKTDIDELYGKIARKPADPAPVVVNNKVTVSPALPGRSIDKTKLASIVDRLSKSEDKESLLPVKFTQPAVTAEEVSAKLFRDVLSSWSTKFYTGTYVERNRSQNIKLAVAKINNYILGPGQVFSFNSVVGERTVAAGYKDAYIYENGKVVSGTGGGICQVSSTLYYTVLHADLDVLERINHMFTVSYVPLGVDAAVAYGSADFKFRNNTAWPIRIECQVTPENKVFFKLSGTNETPGKMVVITTKTLRTLPYTEKKFYDAGLASGKTVVLQSGSSGYVIDTFKTVKVNGTVISEKKLHTSTYTPLNREVKVGTKKIAAPPKPALSPKPAAQSDKGTAAGTQANTVKPSAAVQPSPVVKPTPAPAQVEQSAAPAASPSETAGSNTPAP